MNNICPYPVTIIINIEKNNSPWPGPLWKKRGGVYIRGHVFLDGNNLIEDKEMAEYFNVDKASEFIERLKRANGFFSVVVEKENLIFAAVDQIRSIPLFYGFNARNELVISERAEAVRQAVGDNMIGPQFRNQFLHAGYVLGARTLLPNVRQLQAGEMLYYDRKSGSLEIKRYYLFLPHGGLDSDENILFNKLDAVYEDIFSRLIKWLDGRQVVIPLSGGYDSRLVALMFKELGYKNVLCFSYLRYRRRQMGDGYFP